VVYMTPKFRIFGVGLMFAKGFALAILGLTTLNMLTMCRDFCSYILSTCVGKYFGLIFNNKKYIHKFGGLLIVIFSIGHT